MILIADVSIIDQDEASVHLNIFASTVQKRVASSTMNALSYQLADVIESADLLRAAIAVARGQLDHSNDESSSASSCVSQWSTDCCSCAGTLFASW